MDPLQTPTANAAQEPDWGEDLLTAEPVPPPVLTGHEPDWGEELFAVGREFVDNPEPRCPCVLLLDTSSSMAGEPLAALEAGLDVFRDELQRDPLARQRVEVAMVTFGSPVEVVRTFETVDRFELPPLQPRGQTPLGTALLQALDLIESRKVLYRAHGVTYSRPWLFLITDGMPQGEPWELTRQAVRRLRAEEAAGRILVHVVGVAGANQRFLSRLSARPPLALPELRFVDLFLWLSASAGRAACSTAGEQEPLPPPDWGTS
jgi:uncharacterized protein YegL